MKSNQYFTIRRTIFFIVSYLFCMNLLFSSSIPSGHISACHFNFFSERGLEIRYIIIQGKTDQEKDEIIIDNIKYPLFKTKESAIETIKYANPKKDYTIVYVLTEIQKKTEIISIPENND